MSERTPLPTPPKLGENVKDFSDKSKTLGELEEGKEIQGKDEFYHSVADDYIEKYAGDVAPEDKEQLSASVAAEVEKIFRSEQYGTKEQQVRALEKLILDLRAGENSPEQTNPTAPVEAPATPERDPAQSTRPEGVPTTAEAEQAARDAEDNKHKYSMWQKAKMVIGGPALLATTAWSAALNRQEKQRNKFIRQPNETDEAYKKRTRRAMMFSAPVWITAAYFGSKAANYNVMDMFDGFGDTPKASANPAEGA